MTTKNPLGDIAKVFEGLDDTALQSLFDRTDAELTLRRTAQVHEIFLSLIEAQEDVGHTEKDESECVALRGRDGQLVGVRVTLPFRGNYPVSNVTVWEPVIAVLAANCPEFDFQIQLNSFNCKAVVTFAVLGLKTVPGISEVLNPKEAKPLSLTTVLSAFFYLKDGGKPLQESAPATDEEAPSTLPDVRGPVE